MQQMSLGTDTEAVRAPHCIKNISREIADECKEIVPDSEDEGMHGTEVAGIPNEMSPDKTEGRGGRCVGKRRFAPGKRSYEGYLRRQRNPLWRLDSSSSSLANEKSSAWPTSVCASTSHPKHYMNADSRVSFEQDRAINVSLNVDKNSQTCQCNEKMTNLGKISANIGKETSTRDALIEKRFSSHKQEELNLCHSDLPKFNYFGSQEPVDSSEADALNFLDLYLSNGDPNAFHCVETGVLDRSTSPRILCSNGAQNLAKIKNRTSMVQKLEVFDWSENLSDKEENSFVANISKLNFECNCNELGCISMPHSVGSLGIQKQKALGNICQLNSVEGRINSSKMESKFQVEDEIGKGVCSSEKAMDTNFLNELDKEIIVNSPQKLLEDEQSQLDVVCTYNIGFDTQVAAEAMEALLYAPPLNLDPSCAHQSPQKILQFSSDPLYSVSADHCNRVSSNFDGTGKQLMQSGKELCGNMPGNFETPQEDKRMLESELLPRETGMPFSGMLPTKKRTDRRSLRNTSQYKEVYHEKIFSKQLDVDFNSFKVTKCCLDDKTREEIRKVTSGAHRNRIQSSSSSLKRFTDRSFKNSPGVMRFNFPKKRRKKDEVMESGLNESKKATDSHMKTHGSTGVDEACIVNKLKLEDWCHPRGKRTHKGVPHHSIGWNDQYASCAEDSVIKYCIGNNATAKMTGPLQSGKKSQYSSKKNHSVILSMQYLGEPGSLSVSNCKSPVSSDKGISLGHDRDNSTKLQPAESDDLVSVVSDVMSSDRTLNVVQSRNHIELYSFTGSKKGRQRGKNLSRSSLTKELVRLGYAKSLPDFMPKDSRRGMDHANVRVLLSKNLDENIIKQQKKIVARLGFSIASCCSDASHFVADKFLRTKNMLEAMAIGIPVVTHLWLESCGQASSFINEKIFILRDDKKEKEIGFSMPVSLALSHQHPLLRDRKVFITQNVKPSKDMIQSLVNAVQGQEIAETEDITTQGEILVVSSEEDYATCAPLLKKGAAVYSSELLLNGIVTQRLEYERYRLFKHFVKKD